MYAWLFPMKSIIFYKTQQEIWSEMFCQGILCSYWAHFCDELSIISKSIKIIILPKCIKFSCKDLCENILQLPAYTRFFHDFDMKNLGYPDLVNYNLGKLTHRSYHYTEKGVQIFKTQLDFISIPIVMGIRFVVACENFYLTKKQELCNLFCSWISKLYFNYLNI